MIKMRSLSKQVHIWHVTLAEKSAFSKIGLQENIVIEDWYSAKPSSVNLASKKCTKMEKVERTRPTRPTHFILDFIFPSPFIENSHTNTHTHTHTLSLSLSPLSVSARVCSLQEKKKKTKQGRVEESVLSRNLEKSKMPRGKNQFRLWRPGGIVF